MEFQDVCKDFPKFLSYVECTILDTIKEKIVRTWTDRILHHSCRTTNRVEEPHDKLKKYSTNSVGDLGTCM